MLYINTNELSLMMVDALRCCVNLISDGYTVQFESMLVDHLYIRLRHRVSGRILTIRAYADRWSLMEGKKILKQCPDA